MSFLEAAKARYSVRKYTDEKIKAEDLEKILEAGFVAPTAKNLQPQRVYVLNSPEAIEKINSVCKCIFGAQTVLMVTLNKDEQWQNPLEEGVVSGHQDVSIVATHMMMEAWELGIGSCWVNFFSPTEVKKAFELNDNEDVVLLMPLGYIAEDSQPIAMHSQFRDKDEIIIEL